MNKKIALCCLLALGTVCLAGLKDVNTKSQVVATDSVVLDGDLLGGARFDYTTCNRGTSDVLAVCEVNVGGAGNSDYSGSGIYLRMKNLTGINTYMIFKLNSTNGAVLQPKKGTFQHYLTTDGTDVTSTVTSSAELRVQDNYFMLPASFDGYIYMNYENDMEKTSGTEDFDPSHVWRIYFEVSKYYDNYAKFDFGDIQTDTQKVLDVSELDEASFNSTFIKQMTAEDVELSQLSKEVIVSEDIDYGAVSYVGSIDGGAQITAKYYRYLENGIVRITLPEKVDLSGAAALTFKAACIGTYPFQLKVYDTNNKSLALPFGVTDQPNNKTFYVGEDENTANSFVTGGNVQSVYCPGTFVGTFVFPIANLERDVGSINLANVKYFDIIVAVHFDYGISLTLGDIGVVDKTTHENSLILDVSEETFEDIYSVVALPDNIFIKKAVGSVNCERVGDTKILNTFTNQDSIDSCVHWDPGDNLCTYGLNNETMKVHIGPFEVGHTYGNYMALHITNGENKRDYNFYDEDNQGQKVFAKGLQVYVKNLSFMDIGVNLQFDDLTNNKTERWILKGYPAMYYAYDVNEDKDYTMFSKSDQFQIPVGFEGYIRLPFDQFEVPDWCIQQELSDGELNLENFSGDFFLTSDNTRYEDLEFTISSVAVYFNETKSSTLFDNTNSIKANLGLLD